MSNALLHVSVIGDPLCDEHAQVSKSVSAAESAAQAEAEAKQRNKAGLDSVLASLQAAKKVNVLDKSRSDWREFKTGDTKVNVQSALLPMPVHPLMWTYLTSPQCTMYDISLCNTRRFALWFSMLW